MEGVGAYGNEYRQGRHGCFGTIVEFRGRKRSIGLSRGQGEEDGFTFSDGFNGREMQRGVRATADLAEIVFQLISDFDRDESISNREDGGWTARCLPDSLQICRQTAEIDVDVTEKSILPASCFKCPEFYKEDRSMLF